MNITKEGIEVKVGQVWKDLDPRMNGRLRRVVAIEHGKAVTEPAFMDGGHRTRISVRRMHKGSTGWQLVLEKS